MEKKKMQKLNKAAVAMVLAASGVILTAPVLPTKASTHFEDLNPNADYYQPVLELVNRGYISGYQDGTFRPNQAITREQAAKMLALALNLNIINQRNPGFSDVPEDHDFYNYIAALANAGIINGYDDKTFRPNEPINRNQMAKIITLGYKFRISDNLTHSFADVPEANANRYFIQTLYDLDITRGTTGITYSPFESVTRGQLATFILRAENTSAEKVKPIKEIGEVIGSDVYINGVKYRVDSSLRNIFNAKNAAALKGAHIEGKIVGKMLKNVSSITINAQGTVDRMLTFDGNNSTFSGELKVQGNYILFENWNLSGPVTIAETPKRALSDLANMRVASLTGLDFIDWDKPADTTENDADPTYNGGGNALTDKPTIDTGGKVVDRMPVIDKYVDFSNCSLQRLVIEENRTYVAATNILPSVTVQGWVRQFEIYANIGTLYIDPDVATTMFGVVNINTIYKNSFKDVFLNASSYVNLIAVDNSSGWMDLGDYFYVNKVIIPLNKMANDIFNDFIKDNGKIGDIEDPGGKDIDRDPIKNTIIPDMKAPTAQIVKIGVEGSSVTAGIRSSEVGVYYYTIRKADDRIPTVREIIEEAETTTLKTSGTGWIDQYVEKTITASELDEDTEHVLYLITKDRADNYSDKVSKSLTTMDGPPRISALDVRALSGEKSATVSFNASEAGQYYYQLVPKTGGATPPTVDEVIGSSNGRGQAVPGTNTIELAGLTPLTEYIIYMVMEDRTGNKTVDVVSDTFTTRKLGSVDGISASRDYSINSSNSDLYIKLTFEENVGDFDETDFTISSSLAGKTYTVASVVYAKDERNKNVESQLILKINGAAVAHDEELTITVGEGVKDKYGNTMYVADDSYNEAIYKYRNIKAKIEDAYLDPSKINEGNGKSSKSAYIVTTITNMGPRAKYYYTVRPATAVKPTTIHEIMNSNNTNSSAYGSAEVKTPGTRQLLNASDASGNENAVFNEGYVLYLVVIDEYNNVSDITEKVISPPTP